MRFYPLSGGWASFSSATCINCGELFVIDKEGTITDNLLKQIANGKICPKCGWRLEQTLKVYPQSFRTACGSIGSFRPPTHIPPDWESKIVEVWELTTE